QTSPLLAGDGNSVRYSFLDLVLEEDRPAILEAMSERYSFVFEDLDAKRVPNSILRSPQKERRAPMKHISIANEAKGVYMYPKQQSVESGEEWREGTEIRI
ncbi:hypothetical protein PENTCL1PPCAC_13083, partial [Pristionchus entomophagus]